MANKRKQKRSTKDTDIETLRHELLTEIGTLRMLFREIIERYQTNVEAELVSCINVLSAPEEENNEVVQDRQKLTLMLKALRSLKLKPRKGRYKDIRRINDASMLLYTTLVEED